jgi:ATP-dependent helicase/nuclease subunit B
MASAFLRASGNNAMLLPRMRPLGSAEEDALLLLQPDNDDAGVGSEPDRPELPLPPTVSALERRMVLTKLILAWAERLQSAEDLDDEELYGDELGGL